MRHSTSIDSGNLHELTAALLLAVDEIEGRV
jgi:hypothetical protein